MQAALSPFVKPRGLTLHFDILEWKNLGTLRRLSIWCTLLILFDCQLRFRVRILPNFVMVA